MNKKIISMDSLLSIEDNEDILQFRFQFKNIPMWPFIRFFCFESAIEEANNIESQWRNSKKNNFIKLLVYFVLSYIYNPFRSMNKKRNNIIIFGTDISNIKIGNRYFNRLNELFATCFEDLSIVIEQSDNYKFRRPKSFKRIYYHDWIRIKARLLSIFSLHSQKNRKRIDECINYVKKYFPYNFKTNYVWDKVKCILLSTELKIPFLYKEYYRLLNKVKPAVVLLEEGHSGSLLSVLIKCAHDLNIHISEFQHGIISINHPAYNYGKGIISSNKISFLPHSFLCYGNYWKDNMRTPSEIKIIGNPYLTEFIATKKKKITSTKKIILFVSAAVDPINTINYVLNLKKKIDFNRYQIIFRPHPLERHIANELYSELYDEIEVDIGNLYTLFNKTDFLIGEISTTIFEALSFGITVFLIDNNYSRLNADIRYFNVTCTPEDFIEKLTSNLYIKNSNTVIDYFWASNWKINYSNFIIDMISKNKESTTTCKAGGLNSR